MKNAIIFCFLLFFSENIAFAEEYRVDDGTVLVERGEHYITFQYTPDNYRDSHVTYVYFLLGGNRNFSELRIYQANRSTISIGAGANSEIIRVGVGIKNCYCVLHRCRHECRVGRTLFCLWIRKLGIRNHLIDPDHIIIF